MLYSRALDTRAQSSPFRASPLPDHRHTTQTVSLLSGNGTHSSTFSLMFPLFSPNTAAGHFGSALGNDSENETASMQSERERKQKVKHVLMRTALLTSEVTPRQPSVPGDRRSTQPIDGPSSCNEPHVCVSKFFSFLNRNLPERPSGAFFVYLPIFQPSTT